MNNKYLLIALLAMALTMSACTAGGNSSSGADASAADAADTAIINPADTFSYCGYTMLAEVLAGKIPSADSTFMADVTSRPSFASHSKQMDAMWTQYKANVVDRIRSWSKENLTTPVDTIFYPFSGPDFNYLSSFFPDARFSVLVAKEKPGKVPMATDKDRANVDPLFSALRNAIAINMHSSFFKTNNMKTDLDGDVQGTIPVMLMFMGMHGYEVINANPVEINEAGEIVYSDPDMVWAHTLDKKYDNGVEIMYRVPGEKEVRKLNFFSLDLSNDGFKRDRLDKMTEHYFKGKTTFLKAASYLLPREYFSQARNAILDNSDMVITGLSGVAHKDFDKDKWDFTFYGNWCPPVRLFSSYQQLDLKDAYASATKHPFNFRYDYGAGTCFYIARKK